MAGNQLNVTEKQKNVSLLSNGITGGGMLKEVINAAEASEILGIPRKVIHFNMQKGIWKFGVVIPPKVTGKTVNTYQIYTRQMCEFFGIPFEERRDKP